MSGGRSQVSGMLCAESSCLVLIDLQERLLPVIRQGEVVLAVSQFLRQVAAIFSVPTLLTEQYPKGLGPVVSALLEGAEDLPRMSKLRFSAAEEVRLFVEQQNLVRPLPITQVCLAGIETHVCVLQTALELGSLGFQVFVVADGTGSRFESDRALGLQRLLSAGVQVVAAESVGFEWCGTAEHPRFRELSQLVRHRGY
ncbi:MAG: isochorismatase family protein [Planctomycetaceae bacterium]